MSTDWDSLLLAYLHDPPDKALSIRGHVPRARDNAKIAVGDHISKATLEDAVTIADPLASIVERLPMPTAGPSGERAVGPRDSQLQIIHPLSAAVVSLPVPVLDAGLTAKEQGQLRAAVDNLAGVGEDQGRNRFLAIWRLWPDALTDNVDRCVARLPADTRTPDHTIWNHLDITSGLKAAMADGTGAALLSFALGPVQRFIEAARSVRDLWSGSMILSWLAFRAMLPVIEQLGPTALVYPALRGIPLLDVWLRDPHRLGDKVPLPPIELRLTASLPHRFLVLVPWGANGATAQTFAAQCRQGAANAVRELADAVKKAIQGALNRICPGWDKRWDSQITSYFSYSTAVIPLAGSGEEVDGRLARLLAGADSFASAFTDAEAVRALARSIPKNERPGYDQENAGRWQYQVELVGRALAARRSVRHIPTIANDATVEQRYPQKCTLLGSFEQMGPDALGESREFWGNVSDAQNGLKLGGVRVRPSESLCAVAMVKRFAGPAFLAPLVGAAPADLRFSDTWTIATAEWLNQAGIDPDQVRRNHQEWNGQWLHWNTEQDDADEPRCPEAVLHEIKNARSKLGKPPVYYAILKLDGDDLGGWLRGNRSPRVRDVMHPNLVEYYEGLGPTTKAALDAKRPVGPALHAAISTALANFALHVVPQMVEKYHGTVIYSGGDDALVLLPARRALACALALRDTYTSDYFNGNGREYLMMGSRATLSGGIVLAHAKDDLRVGLQDARRAEQQAKESGRDALAISVRRRSGEHTSAVCPWSFVANIGEWTAAFQKGASDRWAYHLYGDRPTLEQLPAQAIKAEIRRQLKRAEAPTSSLIIPDQLAEAFDTFRQSSVETDSGPKPRFGSLSMALNQFLTLCHTASFLARGRDA
jgi:CRISPR-associated protein Cmr2